MAFGNRASERQNREKSGTARLGKRGQPRTGNMVFILAIPPDSTVHLPPDGGIIVVWGELTEDKEFAPPPMAGMAPQSAA
jgi:hypothetical protein